MLYENAATTWHVVVIVTNTFCDYDAEGFASCYGPHRANNAVLYADRELAIKAVGRNRICSRRPVSALIIVP